MRAARTLAPILIALSCLAAAPAARAAAPAAAQPDLAAAWKRLDGFVLREMRGQRIPGVSLALTDRTRLLRVKTYGFANLDSRAPLRPDHLLEIGSISKSFTSIALPQLHHEGRFDPKTPLSTHLPWVSIESSFQPLTPPAPFSPPAPPPPRPHP